ncbi:MAG TPA: hypothetical protein VFG50_00620 [Rhodothermales bacterium]|nr:hypothetical protein [Rhodothermales bacterium]
MRRSIPLYLALAAFIFGLTGCEIIGDIFKVGFWIGVVIVAIVVAVIFWVVRFVRKSV